MKKKNKKEPVKTEEVVTIGYQGNVTIKRINSVTGKVERQTQKHNTGKVLFFNLIAHCIAGTNKVKGMPRYLRGFDSTNNATITSFIPATRSVVSDSTENSSVQFEFLIPFTQISSSKETIYLRLFNTTDALAETLAEIDVTSENFKGDGQTNFLVTWIITIGNV